MKSDYEKFNEFLIALGQADRVGFRKKIVFLKRYIKYLTKRKHEQSTSESQ